MTAEEIVSLSKEEQALIWAQGYFPGRELEVEAAERARGHRLTLSLYDDGGRHRKRIDAILDEVARQGTDCPVTDNYMRELAAALIQRGDPLPEQLRVFVADALFRAQLKKKRRGPKRKDTRDLLIRVAVNCIVELYGLKRTRNEASDNVESACSIVAKALTMAGGKISESAVLKAWQANGRPLRRALEKLERNSSYALKRNLP